MIMMTNRSRYNEGWNATWNPNIKWRQSLEEVDYYEAAITACKNRYYIRKYIDSELKNITEINETFKPIWEFTYKMANEEKRVKLVKHSFY
jgi:hypothetical protein